LVLEPFKNKDKTMLKNPISAPPTLLETLSRSAIQTPLHKKKNRNEKT